MSLVARHLEANGIPTVFIGSALDIVEHCRVPRFLFTDFPLGNPCGHPWDRDMQTAIVRQAMKLLDTAEIPGVTVRAPFEWKVEDPDWRDRYNRVGPEDHEKLLAIGDARRHQRGQTPRDAQKE